MYTSPAEITNLRQHKITRDYKPAPQITRILQSTVVALEILLNLRERSTRKIARALLSRGVHCKGCPLVPSHLSSDPQYPSSTLTLRGRSWLCFRTRSANISVSPSVLDLGVLGLMSVVGVRSTLSLGARSTLSLGARSTLSLGGRAGDFAPGMWAGLMGGGRGGGDLDSGELRACYRSKQKEKRHCD